MSFPVLQAWLFTVISVEYRLKIVCCWYLFSLMLETRKHSLEAAAKLSDLHKSQFSRFLKNHPDLAVNNLNRLSRRQARHDVKLLKRLKKKGPLPLTIAILIDSTSQHRSDKRTENVKKFNHGKGYVTGHQWTNIVLLIDDQIIPLAPIPFHSKTYCRQNGLQYRSDHDLLVEYIENLNLEEYGGPQNPQEVIVFGDSGYDAKKIERAIVHKKWHFIIALKKKRSVKSNRAYATTQKSQSWAQVADFFKAYRRLKWQTIRIFTGGSKRKRMEFRRRETTGYLRYVAAIRLVCSEFKKRSDGRRKYLACSDLKATARQILIGYRLRWKIEIFHKHVKMHLGFEAVSTQSFSAVLAHVHWVYCAYILLNASPPGIPPTIRSIPERQSRLKRMIESKETRRIRQLITRIGGINEFKNELKSALEPC